MTPEDVELPVIGRIDSTGTGMLQTKSTVDGDRRLEDWIASNLDASSDGPRANHWNSLIKGLPVTPDRPSRRREESRRGDKPSGWARFHVAYRRGVTVVRLIDQALVQQNHIEELGNDLMDLVEVGNHRVVLNFSAVERLGSWIIGAVGNTHRACAAGDGGRLKLCGLDPSLAEIFEIVGMARDLEVHPGEAEAIDSPWPVPLAPRPLPVDILSVLLALGEPPPIMGGAPAEFSTLAADGPSDVRQPAARPQSPSKSSSRIALRVQNESSEPSLVSVPTSGLTIGRDGMCKFRIGSAQVSKRHAVVERRDGKVFIRDLGSTNGTLVNDTILRDEERELRAGDRIQIGPVTASVLFDHEEPKEDVIEVLPLTIDAELSETETETPETAAQPTEDVLCLNDESDPEHRIRNEVIENTLVITPQFESLSDDETLAMLRSRLQSLYESDLPRRVVVNLEFVGHLSRQAVALLLSHHLRLDWAGGGLRICQAHARIMALLDQVRLTILVDCFPTVDEAVLATWSSNRTGAGPV